MHKYLKESFECSGYCQPAELFGWNLAIKDGRPSKVCRDDIKQELYLIFMFPAIISIIGGFTSGVLLMAQYFLWKPYSGTQGDKNGPQFELLKQEGGAGGHPSQ